MTAFMLYTAAAWAQPLQLNSEIKGVKLFFAGAEVTRTVKVNLVPGNNHFHIPYIAQHIDHSSLQIKANSEINVLQITHEQQKFHTPPTNLLINKLKDSLVYFEELKKGTQIEIQVLQNEEHLLKLNQIASGNQTGINTVELEKLLEIQKRRLLFIHQNVYKNQKTLVEIDQNIRAIKQRITLANKDLPNSNAIINLVLFASKPQQVQLEISYFTHQASWTPMYDIHSKGIGNKGSLTYKASILQSTGEIWDQVKLSLSAANPANSYVTPKLQKEFVDFERPVLYYSNTRNRGARADKPAAYLSKSEMLMEDDTDYEGGNQKFNSYTQQAELQNLDLTFEFELPQKHAIPNDGIGRIMAIQTVDIDLIHTYFAVPKLQQKVFLNGSIGNWQSLNLLPAEVNIYLNNQLTGKTYINLDPNEDSLSISFGTDPRVFISRKNVMEHSKKSFFGNNKKQVFTYEINIVNNTPTPIQINILDQIPTSKNAEIKVETINLSKGIFNEATGVVEWDLKLESASKQSLIFSYSITTPKSKNFYRSFE
jgi:uncharacterized protein (TIGR02231 family)